MTMEKVMKIYKSVRDSVSQEQVWKCFFEDTHYCKEITAVPIVVDIKYAPQYPALFYYNADGTIRYPSSRRAYRLLSPWGVPRPGFFVPIAKYGLLASYCDYYIDEDRQVLVFDCLGHPDKAYKKLIDDSAKYYGLNVEWRLTKLYDYNILNRVLRSLEELIEMDKVVLHWTSAMHLPFAAIYRLYQKGIDVIGTKVVLVRTLRYNDRTRNIIKVANDYMCSNGDQIACLAKPVFHRTLYRYFIQRQQKTI